MFSLNEQHQRMITWMQKRLGRFQADQERWEQQARPTQKIPSGSWRIWLILAGRGFGKTRTGSETIRQWIQSGVAKRVCLLGQNLPEVRRTMIEGESGLLSVHTHKNRPTYWPSQRKLVWPNGGQAFAFSADAYEQLRGPQFDAAWIDELAKFPHAQEVWDQLMFGLRLGSNPRIIITTTPKPTRLIQTLLERDDVIVTRGSTWDNAENLPASYLESLKKTYANTPLEQQEIEGQLINLDSETLWSPALIAQARGLFCQKPTSYWMCVVAIDPAVTSHEKSAETGIMVIGMTDEGLIHVIRDESCRASPEIWMKKAVDLYHEMQADWLVAEMNHGNPKIIALFPLFLCIAKERWCIIQV